MIIFVSLSLTEDYASFYNDDIAHLLLTQAITIYRETFMNIGVKTYR